MTDPTERHPFEVLAEEYAGRLRNGESPSIDEYATNHPEVGNEIRELFPTIAEMEILKRRKEQTSLTPGLPEGLQIERLGDFRIVREIGRGGMGIVYEAEQESLKRRVAVKVLPSVPLTDSKRYQRFEREARTAAKLHHTNIVPVFGVGQQDSYHYYVMQFIDGVGLNEVLDDLRRAGADGLPVPADAETAPGSPTDPRAGE